MSTPVGQNHTVAASISGVVQIVAPAANTRGIEIRTGMVIVSTGGLNLHSGTTAPANHADHTGPLIFGGYSSSLTSHYLPAPLSVPAGYGLWATVSSGSDGALSLTWDLLS